MLGFLLQCDNDYVLYLSYILLNGQALMIMIQKKVSWLYDSMNYIYFQLWNSKLDGIKRKWSWESSFFSIFFSRRRENSNSHSPFGRRRHMPSDYQAALDVSFFFFYFFSFFPISGVACRGKKHLNSLFLTRGQV